MSIHHHSPNDRKKFKLYGPEDWRENDEWRANKHAEQQSQINGLRLLATIVFVVPAYLTVIENYDPMVAVCGIGLSLAIFACRWIVGLIQY